MRSASSTTRTAHHRAMGSTVTLHVHGDPALVDFGLARIDELEGRWSRFLPGSEISRLNETRGIPVFVSSDTRRLVRHGVAAWKRTEGSCDPSVLDALITSGYDRPFDQMSTGPFPDRSGVGTAVPGCAGIEVDDAVGSVTFPPGTGFDPGAIGKGLAADIIAEELMAAGAVGVFVSLGGDLRALGSPDTGDGWAISIAEPSVQRTPLGTIGLQEGAVATSTTHRRRWHRHGVEHHHVIDPTTGTTAAASARLVTTIAGAAWWAEALATRLLLTAAHRWREVVGGDGALIVDQGGQTHVLGNMAAHLR